MNNIQVFTVLGLVGVATSSQVFALNAGDPPVEPNPNCKTPTECVDDYLCPGLALCFDRFDPVPIPEPTDGQDAYDFTDPQFRSLNRSLLRCLDQMMIAYNACVQEICAETYLENGQTPTITQCFQALNARLTQCENPGAGCPNVDGGSYGELVLRDEYCQRSAFAAFQRCAALTLSGGTGTQESIASGIMAEGFFDSASADFASGETTGDILWIPMDREYDPELRIDVSTSVWDGHHLTALSLGSFRSCDDGMIEVHIDAATIPSIERVRLLPIMLEWRAGDDLIFAKAYRVGFKESGVPGDFNRDGERTIDDLAVYLGAYNNNAPRADFNRDGVVNPADLELFLMQFDGS